METSTAIRTVLTERAPAPIGPYSQGIVAGGFLYTAGQVALGPDGTLVGDDAATQARLALENLRAVVEAAGTSLERVVKTTVFLIDMDDFAAVNAVYAEFFDAARPARSTVEVARLPKDGRVEIEAVALMPDREC